MNAPTPEQFLAQPSDPDEDDNEPVSPLESIATSLASLVDVLQGRDPGTTETDELRQALDQADAEHADLLVRNGVLAGRLEEIRAVVKPSTSKLAIAVRAVLDADDTVEAIDAPEPEPEPTETVHLVNGDVVEVPLPMEQPTDDASVEVWRKFGESRGLDLVDNLNRSQIRSALGIPQPVAS
jgi:hypothetical protein